MLRAFQLSRPMRLLFQIAIGDAGLGHSCPTHWNAAPLQGDPHAAHGGDHAADPPPSHGSCTCVGTCTPATGATIPPVVVGEDLCVLIAVEIATPATAVAIVARETHPPLPYGNGPPAL
jgi:hypothetical protein